MNNPAAICRLGFVVVDIRLVMAKVTRNEATNLWFTV